MSLVFTIEAQAILPQAKVASGHLRLPDDALPTLIDYVDFLPVEGLDKFQLEVHASLAACWRWTRLDSKNPRSLVAGVFVMLGCGSRI
ncbi:hypothetical protein [Brevundimonas bullata]